MDSAAGQMFDKTKAENDQTAVPSDGGTVEDNSHPDQSIWGESSLHQTRGAPGRLRAAFTALVHQVDASPPVMTSGRSAVAEAVAAIGETAAAVRRLLGRRMAAVSPWEVAAAVSHGRLLAVRPPARLFSTSRHLEPAM